VTDGALSRQRQTGVQLDFFEVTVDVDGKWQKVWKFVMRLMYSSRDFVWLFERCNQIAFLDGHVRAFVHFGGITRGAVYDNLTAAVKQKPYCYTISREELDREAYKSKKEK
jgi:prepilin-type processing-associated H-X9-DG protein